MLPQAKKVVFVDTVVNVNLLVSKQMEISAPPPPSTMIK
jgi:hypothetical protein